MYILGGLFINLIYSYCVIIGMSLWETTSYSVIFAIIAVIYLVLKYLYKRLVPKKHMFWDKQPVSRNYSHHGIIISHKLPPIPTPPFNPLHLDPNKKDQCKLLTSFLNKHFIRGYYYTPEFIQWAFSPLAEHNTCLVNTKDKQLVGTIAGKDVDISIMGQRQGMCYVDYLAVNKSLRGKRIATGLISRLTSKTKQSSCIFKIESNPLPFDHICRFRYYSYNLNNSNISEELTVSHKHQLPLHPMSERDLPDAHRFYTEKSHTFVLSAQYSKDEFRRWFLPRENLVHTFLRRNVNGEITCLASFFRCDFMIESFWGSKSKPMAMVELLFLLSDDKLNDAKELLLEAKKLGCEYFVAPNTGKNTLFIDRLSFFGGKYCYLQLYNYGTTRKLQPGEVLFNPP
jgi:hypothetical protein